MSQSQSGQVAISLALPAMPLAPMSATCLLGYRQPPNPSVKGTSRKRAAPYVER
jgi:hypothetical protein